MSAAASEYFTSWPPSPLSPGRGREIDVAAKAFSGAHAHRAIHTGAMELPQHRHDWPCLAFHLLGEYVEENEAGESLIDGPAVALHGAGACHAERFGAHGAEALILEFDPDWLGEARWDLELDRTHCWASGVAAANGRRLAALWLDAGTGEEALRAATVTFLRTALGAEPRRTPPAWLARVEADLRRTAALTSPEAARRLEMNPAWVARAYREAVGEGLRERVRRLRAERAIALLRGGDLPLAQAALEAGFCDQSHMTNTLRALTGRTPRAIRLEREGGAGRSASGGYRTP